jgi:hypothetical protein
MLFPPAIRELSDAELVALLREAMTATATGLTRSVDAYLAAQSAEFLVDRMRLAGIAFTVASEPPRRQPGT